MVRRDESTTSRHGMSNLMNPGESTDTKNKLSDSGGGRKAILLLFFVSIFLSLFFWMQGQFTEWLRSFFGPSTWTFTR